MDFSGGFGCGSEEIFKNFHYFFRDTEADVSEVSTNLKPRLPQLLYPTGTTQRKTEEEEEGHVFGLSKLINSNGQMILYSEHRLNSGSGALLRS